MKPTRTIAVLGLLIAFGISHHATAREALQGPTELLFWDKAKAHNGHTLFSARGTSFLIDMEGRVVHTWAIGTTPRLLENGNLLDATKDDPSGFQGFRELDWEGKTVWEYTERRDGYAPHHDWVRIYNKKLGAYTTLYIANKSVTHEQAIAAGADPRRGRFSGVQMDAIVEVDMDGNVVWEWWFFDHVVQDVDPGKPNYAGQGKTVADCPHRIDINMPGHPLKRDWLHCNSLDYNAELGHVVTNSVHGEFYVIDHDGTFLAGDPKRSIELAAGPGGDFLYRFGDPARYAQGDPPRILENWNTATSGHKQIGGSHDVQWIRPGLPGAGHFLIFNNGQYLFDRTSQSSILEINGFLGERGRDTGRYVNPPDAGYERVRYDHDTHKPERLVSNQVVWSYRSKSNQGFFSHIGSGAQRLPNGNTLICAMTEGHFFEVTAEGDLVWEYINPITRDGVVKVLHDSLPMTNAVFRIYRYGPDHPALAGKDLTPQGTLTELAEKGLLKTAAPRGPRGNRPGGPRGRDREDRRRPPRGTPPDRPSQPDHRPAPRSATAAGARIEKITGDLQFGEGPAVDAQGNVFFSDIRAGLTYRWSIDGQLSVVRRETGGANGLYFDRDGNLLACEGDRGRLVSVDSQERVTVLADKFDGKRFNKPNDLWMDPKGGVYFSDPAYGTQPVQDGEHVYYLSPDRKNVTRVIGDMERPNGVVGTPDGKQLYVTDHGAKKTYCYRINDDGSLSDKRLFAPVGADGMTIDTKGNVYLCEQAVLVYNTQGERIDEIRLPESPTNACFGGKDRRTLFVTTRPAFYAVQRRVEPVERPAAEREPQRKPDNGQPRPPWPLVHAKELDTSGDGVVVREEILEQARQTFAGYDANKDDRLTAEEYGAPGGPRSVMAGFVKVHAAELDANGDQAISKDELLATAVKMFVQADANGDGKLTADEYAAATGTEPRREEPRRPREEDRLDRGGRESAGDARPRGSRQGPARHNHPVLVALDADGDGEITAAEIRNAAAALKALDRDGDGWVRREEMRPAARPNGRQRGRPQPRP